MPADRPYPALRALTVCRAVAGAWSRMRVKAPGSRSDPPQAGVGAVSGLQPGPGPGRTAPGRSPQGAKLPGTALTHSRAKAKEATAFDKGRGKIKTTLEEEQEVLLFWRRFCEVTSRGR